MKHMAWSSEVSRADEAFLKSILQRTAKYGSEFFIKRPEFERLILLTRELSVLSK